jgi:hypothetical protein
MNNCTPNESGRKCSRCGWEWKHGGPFPRRNCPASEVLGSRVRREIQKMGVGTELKKLLGKFFIHARENCLCDQRAMLMNEQGVEWCRENTGVIVGWLREEAKNRSLPFVELAARLLVLRAIKNAEKKAEVLGRD